MQKTFAWAYTVQEILWKRWSPRFSQLQWSFKKSNTISIQLTWKMEPEHLDYHLFLPIFFEGIREVEEPYKFLATQGTD